MASAHLTGGRCDIDTSKPNPQTVDEYFASFPDEVRAVLQTLREMIHDVAPGVQEKISYQMPTFMLNGASFAYFAAWKKHIGFYPVSTAMEESIAALADYRTSGKGTVQFPYKKPLPLDLVRAILQFRLDEIAADRAKA